MKSIKKITLVFVAITVLTTYVGASVTLHSFLEKAEVNSTYKTTDCVSLKYKEAIAQNFIFEEEGYVNDIPFNTDSISDEYNYLNIISENFEIEEEQYINDIPFNTKKIVRGLK